MSKNLLQRFITSSILLFLLFFIIFSHQYIFILSILILGFVICVEANKIISKILNSKYPKKFNSNFLILNLLTFCYVFFVFCIFSYEIYSSENAVFFFYVISICFFTDIGGYAFGKIIGGRKLTKISPNKTVSGTIGSFISSIIPLIFFLQFNYLNLELNINNIVFCLLISLISQSGDLFISFLKRKAKVKDTGNLLPGHGGILDRVDGIIFAVPFSYLLLDLI